MGTRSAAKAWRQSERRRLRNTTHRSAAKTYVRTAVGTITSGDPEASAEAVRQAISALDRAAQKGAIHRNSAARRKARLMRRYNLALGAAAAAKEEAPKPTRKRTTKKETPAKATTKKRGGRTKK